MIMCCSYYDYSILRSLLNVFINFNRKSYEDNREWEFVVIRQVLEGAKKRVNSGEWNDERSNGSRDNRDPQEHQSYQRGAESLQRGSVRTSVAGCAGYRRAGSLETDLS